MGGYLNTVTVSPDGSLCASGGKDGQAMLWDLHEGKHLYTLDGGDTINALTFLHVPRLVCRRTNPLRRLHRQLDPRLASHSRQRLKRGRGRRGRRGRRRGRGWKTFVSKITATNECRRKFVVPPLEEKEAKDFFSRFSRAKMLFSVFVKLQERIFIIKRVNKKVFENIDIKKP